MTPAASPIPAPAPTPARNDHLATLTAVRFFAALWVTLYHYELFGAPLPGGPVRAILGQGHLGVTFFFVLSGFILAHTYASRILAPRFEWKPFLVARIARVYPLYVASLALGALQQTLLHTPTTSRTLFEHPIAAIASNLFLVQNWNPYWRDAINGPGWSIACEAAFYLAFPLFATVVLRASPRGLLAVAIGAMLSGLALSLVGANLAPEIAYRSGYRLPILNSTVAIGGQFLPFARFDEFILGIVSYRVWREWDLRRLLAGAGGSLLILGCGVGALHRLGDGLRLPVSGLAVTTPAWSESLFPIVSALFIVGLARAKGDRPRWLARPAFVYGGKISFALYLVHLPALFAVLPLRDRGVPPAVVFGIAFVVALALAAAGFRFVEEPMRGIVLSRSRRARKVAEPFPAAP